jgi:arylsulfatase
MMMISSVGTSIGYNHGSAVSDGYKAPFAFGGTPAVQQARAAAEMSRQ